MHWIVAVTVVVFGVIFSKIYDSSSSSSLNVVETTPLTRITILSTNDLHSVAHKYETLSKYIRKIQDEQHKQSVVITLDAGDWFSGSMYDRLSVSSKYSTPQLDYFEMAGYDAVTLGNHEFDAGEDGLVTMLSSQSDHHRKGVPILNADIQFRHEEDSSKKLQDFHDPHKDTSTETGVRIQSSLVLVRQNLTIGILGVMGPDSVLLCQHSRRSAKFDGFSDSTGLLRFDRVARKVKRVVRDLREEKNADFVILIAHSGGEEIYNLASSVADSGVDVVVGGHTHELQFHEIVTRTSSYYDAFFSQGNIHKNRVFVTQCGSDGDYVGKLELDVHISDESEKKILRVSSSTRDLISSSQSACVSYVKHDESSPQNIDIFYTLLLDIYRYESIVSSDEIDVKDNDEMAHLVSDWQNELSKILGRNPKDIVFRAKEGTLFSHDDTRSSVAQLVADGILKMLNHRLSSTTARLHPFDPNGCNDGVDVYLTCPDCVRAFELPRKNHDFELSFEQVYRMLSISASKGISIFHMRKSDLASIVELAEFAEVFVSDTMKLSISSTMHFDRNRWGIPFVNRLLNFTVRGVPYEELDDVLCVALNGYITPYFFLVNHLSKGVLNNFPRDHTGALVDSIDSISKLVFYDDDTSSRRNISEYELFVDFLSVYLGDADR